MTLQLLQEGKVIFSLELRDDDKFTKIDFVEQLVKFVTEYSSTLPHTGSLAFTTNEAQRP